MLLLRRGLGLRRMRASVLRSCCLGRCFCSMFCATCLPVFAALLPAAEQEQRLHRPAVSITSASVTCGSHPGKIHGQPATRQMLQHRPSARAPNTQAKPSARMHTHNRQAIQPQYAPTQHVCMGSTRFGVEDGRDILLFLLKGVGQYTNPVAIIQPYWQRF